MIRYKSWHDLRSCLIQDLFGDERFVKSRFLFRGQSNIDWPLISSYDRWFEGLGVEERHRSSLAQQLRDSFRDELAEAGHADLYSLGEERLLSVGQHHGLPTRLLDWTESPYVAVLFAFMNVPFSNIAGSDVALWALDTTCHHWSSEHGATIIKIDNPGSNVRLRNQEGRFTLLRTPQRSLDDYIRTFQPDSSKPLQRFALPASEAVVALSELSAMGITPSRVYPDLLGLAMAAKLRCHLGQIK